MPTKLKIKPRRGGARSNAGRPPKLDKDKWGQITCVLRHDTIDQLRVGANSRFFGEFLQHHLDRFTLPTREQYLALQARGGIVVRKPRARASWNDRAVSAEERFTRWLDDATQEAALQREQRKANLLALGFNADQIAAQLAGQLPKLNDKPRKARPRKSLAHQNR